MTYPQIYVACLSAYNCGYLHGKWLDATQDPVDIRKEIEIILQTSPVADEEACEEWAIHEYENFKGISIGEYESLENVSQLANAVLFYGAAFAAFYESESFDNIDSAISQFEDRYQGEYQQKSDFALEYAENCGHSLEESHPLYDYINFDRYADDLFSSSFYYVRSGNSIYVFAN
ncbi:MAG: antirestriction protein ArdA [Prochloraceae cyanobacterium]